MIDPGTLSGERLAVLIEHALLSGTKEQKKPAAAAAADLLDDAMSSGTVAEDAKEGNENAIYAPGNQPSNLHHNGGFGTEFDSAAVDQTSAYEFRALEAGQKSPLATENLLEDTDGLPPPPLEGGATQSISALSMR